MKVVECSNRNRAQLKSYSGTPKIEKCQYTSTKQWLSLLLVSDKIFLFFPIHALLAVEPVNRHEP